MAFYVGVLHLEDSLEKDTLVSGNVGFEILLDFPTV